MVANLKTEAINLNELKKNEKTILVVEGDVIVPDVNPDISKLLAADASASIVRKKNGNGKIEIEGCVFVNILYTPESADDISPKIKAINTKLDFSNSYALGGENLSVSAKATVIRVDYKVVNSRKVNVKVSVELGVKIYSANSHLLATGTEDDKAEMKTENISIHSTEVDCQEEFIFTERLEVPVAKCDIEELLKTAVSINKGECKISEGKISLRGSVSAVTLYSGFEEGYIYECMEHELPFYEEIEIAALSEECMCNVTYDVKDMSAKIENDENGDPRIVDLNVVICANVTASKIIEREILNDLYYPGKSCELKRVTKNLRKSINEGTSRVSLKNTMTLSDGASEIYRVSSVASHPVISECIVKEDKLILKGEISAFAVYCAKDGELWSETCEFDFEHIVDIDAAPEGSLCEYDLAVTGTNYNILGEREIEIRTNVEFFVRVTKDFEINVISECEISEMTDNINDMPQLVIYFVQKNDTLWDIAKRYNTTIKRIKEANHIEELSMPGEKIIIPAR